jgi:hypothetical protein
MTKENYERLRDIGLLWEFYPEASGYYEEDIENGIITLEINDEIS